MPTSTINCPLTVGGAGTTQVQADTIRDNGIRDFCLAYKADIYVVSGTPASGIDSAKAVAFWRAKTREFWVDTVKTYRKEAAAITAIATAEQQASTELA